MNWKITECVLALIAAIVLIDICDKNYYEDVWRTYSLGVFMGLLIFIVFALSVREILNRLQNKKKEQLEQEKAQKEEEKHKAIGKANLLSQEQEEIKSLKKQIEEKDAIIARSNNQLKQFYYYLIISNTDRIKEKADVSEDNMKKILQGFQNFLKDIQQ